MRSTPSPPEKKENKLSPYFLRLKILCMIFRGPKSLISVPLKTYYFCICYLFTNDSNHDHIFQNENWKDNRVKLEILFFIDEVMTNFQFSDNCEVFLGKTCFRAKNNLGDKCIM